MTPTCEICNCPLTILLSPREKRSVCAGCDPEKAVVSSTVQRALAPILRLDEYIKNRDRKGKLQ